MCIAAQSASCKQCAANTLNLAMMIQNRNFRVYKFKPESVNSLTSSAIAVHHVRTIGFAVRCSSAYHLRTCNQFHFVRKCGTISEWKNRKKWRKSENVCNGSVGNQCSNW